MTSSLSDHLDTLNLFVDDSLHSLYSIDSGSANVCHGTVKNITTIMQNRNITTTITTTATTAGAAAPGTPIVSGASVSATRAMSRGMVTASGKTRTPLPGQGALTHSRPAIKTPPVWRWISTSSATPT